MNVFNKFSSKLGISAKTAIVSGIVVLVLLAINSFISLNLETNLVNFIMDEDVKRLEKTIGEQGEHQETDLNERMEVITGICAGIASTFMYNLNTEGLATSVGSFFSLPEIVAIKALDQDGKPFLAAWKEAEIKTAASLPRSLKLDESLSFIRDSIYLKEKVGTVQIYFSLAPLLAQLDKSKAQAKSELAGFRQNVQKSLNKALTTQVGVSCFVVFILILTIILCLKLMANRPLFHVIESMGGAIDQVATASIQVSSASKSVADGTSEQAASIEETSASLEQMSSMTKQSADNSKKTDNIMNEVRRVVQQADQSMTRLTGSMQEIATASQETQKIVKAIDEIAFQTNLLALNAAVEAARAGEAGAGFAVVADEVRNLAIRAADAAKETERLIEETVKKVNGGSGLVSQTSEAFTQIEESSSKAGTLIGEIASAADEQAKGIDQVSKAVVEMDKVVQLNAANAEQSAAASRDMNTHVEEMKKMVGKLVVVVAGNSQKRVALRKAQKPNEKPVVSEKNRLPGGAGILKNRNSTTSLNLEENISPEKLIPFDEDNFQDF